MPFKREQTKEEIISFLRKLNTEEIIQHMKEILNEGAWDFYDPCLYEDENSWVNILLQDSARTLINSYIIENLGKDEDELVEYTLNIMRPKFIKSLRRHYIEQKEDCE